ncbi:CUN028 hypothetical protein [Culex nigripalpus nucleopolyhedrovirus]|uniref:Uncharacterized protein n=1 Tax=Culex nigripalpus nucleopolyhedrovirus (isolate Florida/1997) TaxID=645993 RepID=Q919P1_NPVCO|nr:CUN028 hypothetical protein [Culex nigripalpus nucleopolyhedrovirus]AAK94106.1 CUN028 hypothetical protein [Culex nigripalpus nucleopolyhedrovirus]
MVSTMQSLPTELDPMSLTGGSDLYVEVPHEDPRVAQKCALQLYMLKNPPVGECLVCFEPNLTSYYIPLTMSNQLLCEQVTCENCFHRMRNESMERAKVEGNLNTRNTTTMFTHDMYGNRVKRWWGAPHPDDTIFDGIVSSTVQVKGGNPVGDAILNLLKQFGAPYIVVHNGAGGFTGNGDIYFVYTDPDSDNAKYRARPAAIGRRPARPKRTNVPIRSGLDNSTTGEADRVGGEPGPVSQNANTVHRSRRLPSMSRTSGPMRRDTGRHHAGSAGRNRGRARGGQ